jgi:predicted ATPase/transcriptional regulator with XRE-family HTH domain
MNADRLSDQLSDLPTFGDLLRRHRLAAGLSQEELAERASLSRRGISDLERGARTHPHRETLALLVEALGLEREERRAFLAAARVNASSKRDAASVSSGPLPSPSTLLIGRADEVTTATALLRDPAVRLLTLTGAGGSGKTRLAIETANQLRSEFPDGVVFVDLAPLSDPALVSGAIAATLHVREQPGQPLLQTVGKALTARRLLLVLDNFEQLLPAAVIAHDLLTAAPHLKILATSRARLALAAEQELPVLPLAVPDLAHLPPWEQIGAIAAVRLFVLRARALEPGFALTAENAPVVAEICRRLDGLPLALELAAARIKLLPPAALLARLERALPLLVGGVRDLPTRQRTLRATIAWSYDLLDAEEQRLFRRLSVFSGGWTLEAAEAVTNPDGTLEVLTGIGALVDWSLVRQSGKVDEEPRYTMLETIREFALEQLSRHAEEETAIHRAHADYFAGIAWAVRSQLEVGVPDGIRRLRVEEANLRTMFAHFLEAGDAETALRMAGGSLSRYWAISGGQFTEARTWLERALQACPGAGAARARGLRGLSFITMFQGDFATARAAAAECRDLALAHATDDPEMVALSALSLSVVEEAVGEVDAAAKHALEAVEAARALDDPGILGWSLFALAGAWRHAGDPHAARSALEEALTLFQGLGGAWGESNTLKRLAQAARAEGHLSRAARLHADALRVRRDAGMLTEAYDDLVGIAEIAHVLGFEEPAARLLGAEETYHTMFGTAGWGITPIRREQTRQAVIEQLGQERFQRAWDAGRALSSDDVITEALVLADELADAAR